MAFVNLPPNLQDIFYSITDRVAKLETGPNEAMYTAEYAQFVAYNAEQLALYSQSVATEAQVQAINAGIAANQAAAQATIAQSQATIASTQATTAQASANGKNKVWYSTGAPGTTANNVGDIWYQYGTTGTNANKVIAQWSGAGGNSWTSVTISGLVIANIDAGSITTGTLSAIQIGAGSGGTQFTVSSTGVMTAKGASIQGAIVADSGTFNGSVKASSGYFGGTTDYWSIGSQGITGVGSAEITGGKINGSSIAIGTGGTTPFTVSTAGIMTCSGAIINGQVNATSGYIGSSATAGWNFTSTGFIKNADNTTVFYPTTTSNTYFVISDRGISCKGLSIKDGGDIFVNGSGDIGTSTGRIFSNGQNNNRNTFSYVSVVSAISIGGGYGIDSDWSPNTDNLYDLGIAQTGPTFNRRWRKIYSNSTSISTSDARLKTDISDTPLGLDFINALRPVNYRWINGGNLIVKDEQGKPIYEGEDEQGKPILKVEPQAGKRLHYGFLAQEVKQALDASGVEDFAGWVQDDLSNPDSTQSLSYEQFIAPLVKAVQELSNRVKQLEGK